MCKTTIGDSNSFDSQYKKKAITHYKRKITKPFYLA